MGPSSHTPAAPLPGPLSLALSGVSSPGPQPRGDGRLALSAGLGPLAGRPPGPRLERAAGGVSDRALADHRWAGRHRVVALALAVALVGAGALAGPLAITLAGGGLAAGLALGAR